MHFILKSTCELWISLWLFCKSMLTCQNAEWLPFPLPCPKAASSYFKRSECIYDIVVVTVAMRKRYINLGSHACVEARDLKYIISLQYFLFLVLPKICIKKPVPPRSSLTLFILCWAACIEHIQLTFIFTKVNSV